MIFQLTAKNCRISKESRRYINQHLKKMAQALPNIESDLVVLRLTIRKNIDKYHPPKVHRHRHKTYSDLKPAIANFEGSVSFRLNKNRIYAHFKGVTVFECVVLGFDRLFEKIKKFKDLHFSAESKYPDHRSIRRGALFTA